MLLSSARVTDDSLDTIQLSNSMDALWVSAKAENPAPAAVPARGSKVRRRVTGVVATLVVAGIGAGGAPAFADWVALHTGRYDTGSPANPEPKTPEREMWRMDSPELAPHLRTWEKQYPLAPGYSLAPLINDYSALIHRPEGWGGELVDLILWLRFGRGVAAGLSGFSTFGSLVVPSPAVGQVVGVGGPVAVAHSVSQAGVQGQWRGRWSMRRRPVFAIRAGTLMIFVRRVAQRALARPAATALARARLNAITAQATQAAFAA